MEMEEKGKIKGREEGRAEGREEGVEVAGATASQHAGHERREPSLCPLQGKKG